MHLPIYEVVELCVEHLVAACIDHHAEHKAAQQHVVVNPARSAELAAESWLERKLHAKREDISHIVRYDGDDIPW